jgi:hypothetical protein
MGRHREISGTPLTAALDRDDGQIDAVIFDWRMESE